MLVLRRRAGEAIVLGGGIEIEVMEISRTRVKLGVRAPRDVTVARREAVALAAENREASDLISRRGQGGVSDLLRLLRIHAGDRPNAGEMPHMGERPKDAETSKDTAGMADM